MVEIPSPKEIERVVLATECQVKPHYSRAFRDKMTDPTNIIRDGGHAVIRASIKTIPWKDGDGHFPVSRESTEFVLKAVAKEQAPGYTLQIVWSQHDTVMLTLRPAPADVSE